MAAKLVFAMLAVAFIVGIAVVACFWYFNQHDERQHERDLKQMEHTERILESETQDPIDRELEQEKKR